MSRSMPGTAGSSAPGYQRWEMLVGILGFFTFVSLVTTVVAEVRGDPALTEVIVLVFFLSLTYYAYRAWQRS